MKNKYIGNILSNMHWGFLNLVITGLLTFVSRKFFLKVLGLDLLSIGVTITNLIGILSITELGISNAVMFLCYEPLKQKKYRELNLIIKTYKKANIIIGIGIFILGLSLLPFLHKIVTLKIQMEYLYIIYILILISNVSTYFFSYNNVLLSADQKEYKITRIRTIFQIVRILFQIFILIYLKNYIVFLVSELFFNVLTNYYIYFYTLKNYPFLNEKYEYTLIEKEKNLRNFKFQLKGMAAVKIAGVVINNTDTILISWINTLYVGLVSNYLMLINLANSIFSIFTKSVIPAIGNYRHEKDNSLYLSFKTYLIINNYFTILFSVIFFVLANTFIKLWLGERFILNYRMLVVITILTYHNFIKSSSWVYRDALGYFTKCKNFLFFNAILNIIFSFLFGYFIGIEGIFIATIVSSLLTNFWYDIKILYKEYFNKSVKDYFLVQIRHFLFMVLLSGLFFYQYNMISNKISILLLIIEGFIIIIFVTILYFFMEKKFFFQIYKEIKKGERWL